MVEYITMGQIEKEIEQYYHKHHAMLSFYDALTRLTHRGASSPYPYSPAPDFAHWNLNNLDGLLTLFSHISVPLVVDDAGIAEENAQRALYGKAITVFKQPCHLQTLDHPEHAREPTNAVRIIYVLKGTCEVILDKWSAVLEEESVILLSSDMNVYLHSGERDIVLNVFVDKSHFAKSFFAGMPLDSVMTQFFERAIYDPKDGFVYFKLLQPEHVHSIYQRLLVEMNLQDSLSSSIIQEYIRLLCMELNRASMIYSGSVLDKWSDSGNRLLQAFPALLQYIRTHYESVSLTSLSERFHYDSAYLSKMIKKFTGKNFTSILTQTRMEAAEQMLRDGQKPESIAVQVGYESYDHFVRLFKKEYSITPTEFQRHCNEDIQKHTIPLK